MAGNIKYSVRQIQNFLVNATSTALFVTALFFGLTVSKPEHKTADSINIATADISGNNDSLVSQPLLQQSDKTLYREIFSAQQSKDWKKADEAIAKLQNNLLIGDVLAERFLNPHYDTSISEIVYWLKNHYENTQTPDIVELANRKYPEIFSKLPRIEKRSLQGYGDGNAKDIRFSDNKIIKKLWTAGLDSWRANKKQDAAYYFSALSTKKNELSDWQYSAVNFWAARALHDLGYQSKANEHLQLAASNAYVFYGILAHKLLKKPLELDTKPIETTTVNLEKLLSEEKIQRIIALAQLGFSERAEAQMRKIFLQANKSEKWGMLHIASELNLASVQISMAKQLESNDRRLDIMKYPIPDWKPEGGFSVDPSLIYALMRQESGFHTAATSTSGAMGLMQLMPNTAKIMNRAETITIPQDENFHEPVLNITLGERYVEHLLKNDLINGNLFYMLTAYNAGIGRLKEWQNSLHYNDDPLLFIETIPFAETHSYVLQVMTNYWIYSELTGAANPSIYSLKNNSWSRHASK